MYRWNVIVRTIYSNSLFCKGRHNPLNQSGTTRDKLRDRQMAFSAFLALRRDRTTRPRDRAIVPPGPFLIRMPAAKYRCE